MSVDVAASAARRRDRTRRWFTGVVVVAAVAGAVAVVRSDPADPGDPAARTVSRNLEEGLVPYLGVAPFAGTADLRAVTRPSDEVRAWFTSERAVYRVVDARRDEATLVVWQRAETGPGLLTVNRTGEGRACARLYLDGTTVRSEAQDCPDHLGPRPDSERRSWGRGADAVAAVDQVIGPDAGGELVWAAMHQPDGRVSPASVSSAAAVYDAVRATNLVPGTTLRLVPDVDRGDGHVRGRLTVTATARDAVDTRRTVTTHGCAVFDVDLTAVDAAPVTTRVPCA